MPQVLPLGMGLGAGLGARGGGCGWIFVVARASIRWGAVQCPFCEKDHDKVIDSRTTDGGAIIRRRRECLACGKRFTTYERVEQTSRLTVVKRDGRREGFSREKLLHGVLAAVGKRNVARPRIEALLDAVEEDLAKTGEKEVPSLRVGETVLRHLIDVDQVAFVRFASEYHQFDHIDDLRRVIDEIAARVPESKQQGKLF